MGLKEKLVELIAKAKAMYADDYTDHTEDEYIAETLLDNGVTVQECGEWVYDHWCEFKCSVCGEFSNSKPYKGKENYCPNCGAKMMPQPPKGKRLWDISVMDADIRANIKK